MKMDKHKKGLIIGLFAFALEIIFFYFLWWSNLIMTIAFLILSVFMLLWSDNLEKIVYFSGFVLFPIVDVIVVRTGIWSYGNPTLLGVPVWLPFPYALSSLIIIKIGKSLYNPA